jgi:hypothetical protein
MSKFNLFLSSDSPHIDQSTSELNIEIGFKRKEPRAALKSLLCNLLIKPNSWILVQRKKQPLGTKRGNPLGIGIESFRRVLDALDKHGFIEQNKGSKLENKKTEIKATENLLIWFDCNHWLDDDIDIFKPQYITLRLEDPINKKEFVLYDDTQYSIWLSSELKRYNSLLNNSSICLPNKEGSLIQEKKLVTKRGFIKHEYYPKDGEFLFGGRHVGPWVNTPSEDRERITINGESTKEVDRVASHINAMYEVVTGQPYQGGDPYELFIHGVEVPRHIVKNLASFSQGANTARGVSARVGRHYNREATKKDARQKDVDKHRQWLRFIKKTPATKIHQALMSKHHLVRDYYLRGKQYGDMIQCWEADLVFEVVRELTSRGAACLTVYDSFIVQSKYEDLVEDLVKKTRFINRRNLADLLEVDKEVAFTL